MNTTNLLNSLRANRGVVALCATIFFFMVGQGAVSPVLPLFARDFGVGVMLVALAVGLFGIGRLVMGLPGGLLAQRYGRRLVLVGGVVLGALGAILMAFSTSFGQLLFSRGIIGFGSGTFTVGASIYLRDVSTRENRARYQSLQELSILVGVTVGPVVGGFLAEAWGLRAPFYLQACVMGVAILVSLAFIPETKHIVDAERTATAGGPVPVEGAMGRSFGRLLLNPGIIAVGLFNLMIVAHRQGGRFTIMPLFGAEKGFGSGQLGVFFTVTHMHQFFAVLAAGILADRFGRKVTIMPAAVFLLLGIFVFIYGDSYPLLLVSGLLMGIGEGLAGPPSLAFFADMAPRGLEGVTMGLHRTYGGTGTLLGAMFLGALADRWGFGWSLWVNGLLLMVTGLAFVIVAREIVGQRPSAAPGSS